MSTSSLIDPLSIGESHLTPFQLDILKEAYEKKYGTLSLPMGSGKTLISIVLALKLTKEKILIVASKSLIPNWIEEIEKFFENSLDYEVYHKEFSKKNFDTWKPNARLVLTTPETIAKFYREGNLENRFVEIERVFPVIYHYIRPNRPMMNEKQGGEMLFSINWGTVIIDEIQTYLGISSDRSRGLACLYSQHKWGLSGTVITEPKIEKILGYYTILSIPNVPNDIAAMKTYLRNREYKGLNSRKSVV